MEQKETPMLHYQKYYKYIRVHFAELRLSDRKLNIELGQRSRPPELFNPRLCAITSIEDEKHYILHCTKHNQQRILPYNVQEKNCKTFRQNDENDYSYTF